MRTSGVPQTATVSCNACPEEHIVVAVHCTVVWKDDGFWLAYRCHTTGLTSYTSLAHPAMRATALALPVLVDPDARDRLRGPKL